MYNHGAMPRTNHLDQPLHESSAISICHESTTSFICRIYVIHISFILHPCSDDLNSTLKWIHSSSFILLARRVGNEEILSLSWKNHPIPIHILSLVAPVSHSEFVLTFFLPGAWVVLDGRRVLSLRAPGRRAASPLSAGTSLDSSSRSPGKGVEIGGLKDRENEWRWWLVNVSNG
jgi:hypothetical protein